MLLGIGHVLLTNLMFKAFELSEIFRRLLLVFTGALFITGLGKRTGEGWLMLQYPSGSRKTNTITNVSWCLPMYLG